MNDPRLKLPVASKPSKKRNDKDLAAQTVVERYGTRHWAIYLNAELLAVTVYKKGALAVQAALIRHSLELNVSACQVLWSSRVKAGLSNMRLTMGSKIAIK